MTLKEELDDVKAKLQTALQDSADAKTKLKTAETERDQARTEANDRKTQLEAEQRAHAETKGKLTAEEDAHKESKTKLEAEEKKDKTAEGKAREQLAANGVTTVAKEEPGKIAAAPTDPVALWEEYAAADSTKQAQMRKTHGDKLDAAAAAFDAAKSAGR